MGNTFSASNQIRALAEALAERVFRGQYDDQKDGDTLRQFHNQAQTLDDRLLEAYVVNVHGVMNVCSGFFTEALEQFRYVHGIYEQANDVGGMATSINNQATIYGKMGDYHEALRLYDRGFQLAADYANQIEKHEIKNYGFLLIGKLTTLTVLDKLAGSDQLYDELWAIAEHLVRADRLVYARVMIYGYRGKSELELSRGQIDEATSAITLALELAQPLDLPYELAEIRLAQAHIALFGANDESAAESYWVMAEETLLTTDIEMNIGCLFAEEARYLLYRKRTDKARYFVKRAIDYLSRTPTPEVEQMIHALSAMLVQ